MGGNDDGSFGTSLMLAAREKPARPMSGVAGAGRLQSIWASDGTVKKVKERTALASPMFSAQ